MLSNIKEEFIALIAGDDQQKMVDFLKQQDEQTRKDIAPVIKEQYKYYQSDDENGNPRWSNSADQFRQITLAGLVCLNMKDFKSVLYWEPHVEYINQIFEFACPDWIGSFLNEYGNRDGDMFAYLKYNDIMRLADKGLIEPSRELVLKLLPDGIIDYRWGRDSNHILEYENLLKFPVTLEEHVWWFFEEPTNIQYAYEFDDHKGWKSTFAWLIENNRIDRERVLRSALSASGLSVMNKTQAGWFIGLFEFLKPTDAEIALLQEEMMVLLNGQQSKPITVVLKFLKKLSAKAEFDHTTFLGYAEVLVTHSIKTIVKGCLAIIDKLVKKKDIDKVELVALYANGLMHDDSAIQKKVCKFINTHGNTQDENLKEIINQYTDSLLTESKTELQAFLSEEEQVEADEDLGYVNYEPLAEENKISQPENITDLVFMLSQATSGNDPVNIETIPAALVALYKQITVDDLEKFKVVFDKASDNADASWSYSMTFLDKMLMGFVNNFSCFIKEKLGVDFEALPEKQQFKSFETVFAGTQYAVIKEKLLLCLSFMQQGIDLPLLSTSTHQNGWIDPPVFIERLKMWENSPHTYHSLDIQMAIAKLYLSGSEKLVDDIKTNFSGELADVLTFLFSPDSKPQGEIKSEALWWNAALAKSPETEYEELKQTIFGQKERMIFTADFPYEIRYDTVKMNQWNEEKGKSEEVDCRFGTLITDLSTFRTNKKQAITDNYNYSLYEYLDVSEEYWHERIDIKRLWMICPSMPEQLMSRAVLKSLSRNFVIDGDQKNALHASLEMMLENVVPLKNFGHILVAGSLIFEDKTIRGLAAENWLRGTELGLMDGNLIGKIMGQYFKVDFVPVKRLTDTMANQMLGLSQSSDIRLKDMIECVIAEMGEAPAKGTKKLLEQYYELLVNHKTVPSEAMIQKLKEWQKVNAVKKVVKQICSH